MPDLSRILAAKQPLTFAQVARGAQPLVMADLARAAKRRAVFIAPEDSAMRAMADAARYFAPELSVIEFPAWDCLPYDRASPNGMIAAERMDTLTRLAGGPAADDPKAGTGSRPRAIVVTAERNPSTLSSSRRGSGSPSRA